MVDPFRSARPAVMDYLEFCAREPSTPALTVHAQAAVLRHVAAHVLEANRNVLPLYRRYRRHRVELVARMGAGAARRRPWPQLGPRGLLVTFAGSLLERQPQTTRRQKRRRQR